MKKQEALDYFGTQEAIARAIGIKQPSVADWGEYPPYIRQLQLEKVTKGKLKAEKDFLVKSIPHDWKKHWPELSILRVPAKAEE